MQPPASPSKSTLDGPLAPRAASSFPFLKRKKYIIAVVTFVALLRGLSRQSLSTSLTTTARNHHDANYTSIHYDGDRISRITRLLETYSDKKYYVYDSMNMTLRYIRVKAQNPKDAGTISSSHARTFDVRII